MSCRLSICIGAFQKRKTPLDDARGFWTRVGRKPERVVNEVSGPNGELRQRPGRSSRRRHRHSEKSVPIAGEAIVAARLDPIRVGMTDGRLLSHGR